MNNIKDLWDSLRSIVRTESQLSNIKHDKILLTMACLSELEYRVRKIEKDISDIKLKTTPVGVL